MAILSFEYPREKRTQRDRLRTTIGDFVLAAAQAAPTGLQFAVERVEGSTLVKIRGDAEAMNWLLATAAEEQLFSFAVDADNDAEFVSLMLRNGIPFLNQLTCNGVGPIERERLRALQQLQERNDGTKAAD